MQHPKKPLLWLSALHACESRVVAAHRGKTVTEGGGTEGGDERLDPGV